MNIMIATIVIIVSGSKIVSVKVGKSERKVSRAIPFTILPIIIETATPTAEPQKPRRIASQLKLAKTWPLLMPRALSRPISRVRS